MKSERRVLHAKSSEPLLLWVYLCHVEAGVVEFLFISWEVFFSSAVEEHWRGCLVHEGKVSLLLNVALIEVGSEVVLSFKKGRVRLVWGWCGVEGVWVESDSQCGWGHDWDKLVTNRSRLHFCETWGRGIVLIVWVTGGTLGLEGCTVGFRLKRKFSGYVDGHFFCVWGVIKGKEPTGSVINWHPK